MPKYLLSLVAIAILAFTSCTSPKPTDLALADGEFLITGQLPADRYDSACLYLVPMQGPHPRPVDSVFVSRDGRFTFRGNVEQMAVLRLTTRRRFGIQDLLVVTEPGVTHVVLDSISSAWGTPQNDALQRWKEHRESLAPETRRIAQMLRQRGSSDPEFKAVLDSFRCEVGDYNYRFLSEQGRNTLTVYLYKMFSGNIDSLRRAELDSLLRDTVDYSQPQPGFRK